MPCAWWTFGGNEAPTFVLQTLVMGRQEAPQARTNICNAVGIQREEGITKNRTIHSHPHRIVSPMRGHGIEAETG